jgi:hypothetical protein
LQKDKFEKACLFCFQEFLIPLLNYFNERKSNYFDLIINSHPNAQSHLLSYCLLLCGSNAFL